MFRLKTGKLNKQKGFTLVELIVVLVLMMILIAISVAGILTWQDWSRFKKENTGAETIFYTLQNQFTELDATDAFDSSVYKKIRKESDLFVAGPMNTSYFTGSDPKKIVYDEDSFYIWEPDASSFGTPIWINTPSGLSSDLEKAKYQGTIWRISAAKGDYDKYLDKTLTDPGTILLFDLLSPYISDKSVLNGAIWVEFSPEARQVFSVCYSDRIESFDYEPVGADSVSIMDRTEATRRENLMGYYAAESLSVPIEGRSKTTLADIELENENTFNVCITEKVGTTITADSHYAFDLCPVVKSGAGEDFADEDSPYMTVDFKVGNLTGNGDIATGFSKPVEADLTFYEGYYASDTFKHLIEYSDVSITTYYPGAVINDDGSVSFKTTLPMWITQNVSGQYEVRVVLDAADVQAQSYLCADKENLEPSIINTYSFYRFGFDLDKENVMNVAGVLLADDSDEVNISNFENPVFANAKIENEETKYDILNGRHLYNVRFETDYKEKRKLEKDKTEKREFTLSDDIDWADFTNLSGASEKTNYFFNSYTIGKTSGINVDYLNSLVNKDISKQNTANYYFPGFLALGYNDTFKGIEKSGRFTTISNLDISFAANMEYGVYGKDNKEEWDYYYSVGKLSDYNEYDDPVSTTTSTVWTELYRFDAHTYSELHPSYAKAMRGLFPLGLFAENSGSITSLELNKHRVHGMEVVKDSDGDNVLVFTNMVGGFAGNNLGIMNDLKLRNVRNLSDEDTITNENTDADATHINGKTDVGGILGRQSWTVYSDKTDSTLTNLENYATVTGMENVGGIVGRAFIIRGFHSTVSDVRDLQNYWMRRISYDDGYDIYGEFTDSGEYVENSSESLFGRKVKRIEKLTISNCLSRGEVCGDDLVYTHVIKLYENMVESRKVGAKAQGFTIYSADLSNYHHKCANIGGIAGILMDGAYYDGKNPGTGFENSWKNGSQLTDIALFVNNCTAYRLYSEADLEVLKSKNANGTFKNKFEDGHIADMIRHDYYTGSFVGYSRFVIYTSCNTKAETVSGYRPFVFGRNYVGGMFGCFDRSQINKNGPKDAEGYLTVNNVNTIGVMYVGGIAGGTGIGSCKMENISYRHPVTNEGSQPSQVYGMEKDCTVSHIKNEGIVLGVKRDAIENADGVIRKEDVNIYRQEYGTDNKAWQEKLTEEYDSGIGGVVGISRLAMYNVDSIQSEDSRNYALQLIGITSNLSGNYTSITKAEMNSVVDSGFYGGNGVGGIVGIAIADGKLNDSNNVVDSCEVKAIIIGTDSVGGIVGAGSATTNCDKARRGVLSDSVVIGRNMVGGIAGINNITLSDWKVGDNCYIGGKNGVGGIIGITTDNREVKGEIVASELTKIKVEGNAYVGSFCGINYNNCKLTGKAQKINVSADYFAGGVAGATISTGNIDLSSIAVTNSENNVGSKMFAGGAIGLYDARINKWNIGDSNKNIDARMIVLANDLNSGFGKLSDHEQSGGIIYYNTQDSAEASLAAAYIPDKTNVGVDNICAGGIFGYIPSGEKVSFNLNAKDINGAIKASGVNNSHSYCGGVVGIIPGGVSIKNASFTGTIVNDKSSYRGEIAELNYGTITGCKVNSMSSNNKYFGGLTGENYGTVTSANGFADNIDLNGNEVLGGLIGVNKGTLELSNGFSATGKMSANGKVGFLIGENHSDIDLNGAGSFVSPTITKAAYAGLLVGINKAEIKNSKLDSTINRYNLSDTEVINGEVLSKADQCAINGVLTVENVNYVGLIAGINEKADNGINNICATKYNDTTKKGAKIVVANNGSATVGGFVGQNGNGTTKGVIRYCYNFMDISATNAAGIAGNIGGKSEIVNCDNYGNITGVNAAAGISALTSVTEDDVKETADDGNGNQIITGYTFVINNCVNTGAISATDANALSAGIACNTNGFGQFELCRNYGTGATYGISADSTGNDSPMMIHNSLEAGGITEANGSKPIAQEAKNNLERNFYIGADITDAPSSNKVVPYIVVNSSSSAYSNITLNNNQRADYNDLDYDDSTWDEIIDDLYGVANNGTYPQYEEVVRNIYRDLTGNNGYSAAVHWTHDKHPAFQEFLKKVMAGYIALDINHEGYDEWRDNLWNHQEDVEFSNYLAILNYVYNNATLPNSLNEALTGTVSDDSHWPVQLYVYNDNSTYSLAYRRVDYYFYAGVNGLTKKPNDLSVARYDVFMDLDQKFVAMTTDTNAYPNGDTDNGNDTVTCGFVGNIVKKVANTNAPDPDANNGGAPDNSNTNSTNALPTNNTNSINNTANANNVSGNNDANDGNTDNANAGNTNTDNANTDSNQNVNGDTNNSNANNDSNNNVDNNQNGSQNPDDSNQNANGGTDNSNDNYNDSNNVNGVDNTNQNPDNNSGVDNGTSNNNESGQNPDDGNNQSGEGNDESNQNNNSGNNTDNPDANVNNNSGENNTNPDSDEGNGDSNNDSNNSNPDEGSGNDPDNGNNG